MKYRNGNADEILAYYSEGHTQAETMERFGITKNQLQYLAKRYKVSNGRTAADICTVNGSKGVEKSAAMNMAKARERLLEALNEIGLELISEYKGKEAPVLLRCRTCGAEFERTPYHIKRRGTTCLTCKHERIQQKHEAERQAKQKAKAIAKAKKENERIIRLNTLHVCKVCQKPYTILSYMESIGTTYERVSGYCSAECRNKAKNLREREYRKRNGISWGKHYTRAKKKGVPYERGVTLPNLIKRDGLQCAICGLMCIYGGDPLAPLYPSIDHIIAIANGGGHTWDNVQVAHRQCNSYKGARTLNTAAKE